jgi:hypothetical protein
MGEQKNMHYRGSVGNTLYYERNGGYYIRSKPTVVRQTKATKASANKFGVAVRVSKAIRSSFAPILINPRDRQMMFQLNTALYRWLLGGPNKDNYTLQPIPALTGFSFNGASDLSSRLKLSLHADWQQTNQLVVNIPAVYPTQDIVAPAYTDSVALQLAVSCIGLATRELNCSCSKTIEIPYKKTLLPGQDIILPVDIIPGSIAVLAAALKYTISRNNGNHIVQNPEWLPAGIISAIHNKG